MKHAIVQIHLQLSKIEAFAVSTAAVVIVNRTPMDDPGGTR